MSYTVYYELCTYYGDAFLYATHDIMDYLVDIGICTYSSLSGAYCLVWGWTKGEALALVIMYMVDN